MNTGNVVPMSVHRAARSGKNAQRPFPNPVRVRFDAFELDEANARLIRDGTALSLAPKPFSLLCALARRPGSLLSKNTLLDEVWGHQFVSESVLKTAISDLRTVLDDHPREPRFIETVSRRGYRFIALTTAISSSTPLPGLAPIPGIDFAGQPSFKSSSEAWPRARRRDGDAHAGKSAVESPLRQLNASRCETGAGLQRPLFATLEEVRYAHGLRLKLRARLLHRDAPSEPLWVGAA